MTIPTGAAARFSVGEQVRLLVRPEDVEVRPLDPGPPGSGTGPDDGLVGSLVSRTFAGAATLVHVRVDRIDALVTAHGPSHLADELEPGARVAVIVDGRRALCEAVTDDVAVPVAVEV